MLGSWSNASSAALTPGETLLWYPGSSCAQATGDVQLSPRAPQLLALTSEIIPAPSPHK